MPSTLSLQRRSSVGTNGFGKHAIDWCCGWHGHFAGGGCAIYYAHSANVSVLRSNGRIAVLVARRDNTPMWKRRIDDDELLAQFVPFSCYRRRRLLDQAGSRQIVVSLLAAELATHDGICCGFVVMPDHVHTIVWFPEPGRLSHFMKQWKQKSSVQLKKFVRGRLRRYSETLGPKDPFWQPRYYSFNLHSEKKAVEKLDYMHFNPVRAGLVGKATDWAWSSARYFEFGEPVGVPLQWVFQEPLVAPQHGHICRMDVVK